MAIKSTIFRRTCNRRHRPRLLRRPCPDPGPPPQRDRRAHDGAAGALAIQAHQLNDLCNGDATLAFGAGLSDPDDPDASLTDFTGRKRVWIEVGQPEDKPLTKACSKADSVLVYCFNHASEVWWKGMESKLSRLDKLQVWRIPTEASQAMAAMAERSMQLQATVQEGALTLSSNLGSVHVEPVRWK
nr:YaeQ family protein [Acidovorax sp. 1608163]